MTFFNLENKKFNKSITQSFDPTFLSGYKKVFVMKPYESNCVPNKFIVSLKYKKK